VELFSNAISPCCQKVKMCLYELNLTFDEHEVSLDSKENLSTWFRGINPDATLPALKIGDKVISDSTQICLHLAREFGSGRLMPSDVKSYSKMLSILGLLDEKLHPASACLLWPMCIRPSFLKMEYSDAIELIKAIPNKARQSRQKSLFQKGLDADEVAAGVKTYEAIMSEIDSDLRDMNWLSGDHFGLADISLAPYLQISKQFGWGDLISEYPALEELFSRLSTRPSFKRGVMDSISVESRTSMLIEGRAKSAKIYGLR